MLPSPVVLGEKKASVSDPLEMGRGRGRGANEKSDKRLTEKATSGSFANEKTHTGEGKISGFHRNSCA
jgi:hypothetical protein